MATSWSLEADKRTGGRETTYYQTQQFSHSAGEPEPAPPLPWISESQNGFPGIILIYKIKKKKKKVNDKPHTTVSFWVKMKQKKILC